MVQQRIIHPVEIERLSHRYGQHVVYRNLSLTFERGKVYALLGKNGVGKTTLIKILMGFLQPHGGVCRLFGDTASAITPATRARVGLLFERHLAYDFFTIEQIEKFYAHFYPVWHRHLFYLMVDKLGIPYTRKVKCLSEGQRSQVVLGLLLAQDPELLILDDYSMGLDAGYRRLFIDYLKENFKDGNRTVIITSHIIQDMENFVDEAIFLKRGGEILRMPMQEFIRTFHCYRLFKEDSPGKNPGLADGIVNIEEHAAYWDIFSFAPQDQVQSALAAQGIDSGLTVVGMSLEDAFIGYTGRY